MEANRTIEALKLSLALHNQTQAEVKRQAPQDVDESAATKKAKPEVPAPEPAPAPKAAAIDENSLNKPPVNGNATQPVMPPTGPQRVALRSALRQQRAGEQQQCNQQ